MGIITKTFYKPEFYLVLLMRHQDTLYVYKKLKISKRKQIVKIKKKQYIMDLENPTYIVDNKRFYYVDVESGAKYTFNEVEHVINADDLDVIVGNKIIRELTAGVMDNKKQLIFYMIVGAVSGILLGLVIMSFVMQNKIDKIYEAQNQAPSIPIIPSALSLIGTSIKMMLGV